MEARNDNVFLQATKAWHRRLAWLPTLYVLRGVPYVAMLSLVPIILNRMGLSNGLNVFCCSWAMLPLIFRPLLGKLTRGLADCRTLILLSELLMGLLTIGMGEVLRMKVWLPLFLLLFYLLAFVAAVHDVGVARYFMICSERRPHQHVLSVRMGAFCVALVGALGVPAMLGGNLEVVARRVPHAWSTVATLMGSGILILSVYHGLVMPRLGEQVVRKRTPYLRLLADDFRNFSGRRYFRYEVLFLLLFLLPEGFFYRVGILFLIDPGSNGGLSLSPQEVAFVQGTVGAFGVLLGCLLGVRCVHYQGFRYWLWPMTMAFVFPKVFYVFMGYTLTTSLGLISVSVFLEQMGFGFGVMAFVAYLAYLSRGYHPVMFYSYCFAIAAAAVMLSGALSGYVADYLGYRHFFIFLMLLGVAPFFAAALVRTEPIEGLKL